MSTPELQDRRTGPTPCTRSDVVRSVCSFYAFTKSMETLEQAIAPDTLLILMTDGKLFRYLNEPQ